jgi:hypothetical protein
MCVELAYKRSINSECASCKQKGASLTCFSQRCPNTYHFPCAVSGGCVFYKNKVRINRKLILRYKFGFFFKDNYVSSSCFTCNYS